MTFKSEKLGVKLKQSMNSGARKKIQKKKIDNF